MPKKLLVPVDGSDHALKAIDFASDLAQKYEAEVVLLHVMTEIGSSRVPPELKSYMEVEHVEITERDIMRSVADEIVNRAVKRAQDDGATKTARAVEVGDPAETVVEYAKANGVDMIVMGRRGLGRFSSALMGSVSQKVGHLAECALTTVV